MISAYAVTGFAIILLGLFIQWQVYVSRIIFTFAVSSMIVAFSLLYQGISGGSTVPILLSVLTAVVRAVAIPTLIVRNLHRTPWRAREDRPVMGTSTGILISLALVVVSLWLFRHAIDHRMGSAGPYAALPFAMLFQGIFLIVSRRNAFIQLTGYLEMENAVLLLGSWGFPGLPLIIEGAVLLDLLGIVVIARIIMRMREESMSADDRAAASAAAEELRG